MPRSQLAGTPTRSTRTKAVAFHVQGAKASDIPPYITEEVARGSGVHADELAS